MVLISINRCITLFIAKNMAAVTINIPNIGNVVAENAASEETLQKILAAMQKQGGGKGGSGKEEKLRKDGEKAQEKELEGRKKISKAMEEGTKESGKSSVALQLLGNYIKESGNGLKAGFGQASMGLLGWGKTLANSAIAVATSFATTYDQMAKDPIGAASTMLATNIDVFAAAGKAAVDVVGGAAAGLASAIPVVGGAVSGVINALSSAAKAAIDFAASVLKLANQVFAQEFKKSADMLHNFTKAGASFAGGMTEMRNVAHASGVGMETFSKIVMSSGEEIRNMGLNQADGARAVAAGMKALTTTVGRSGNNLRDEMLAMGYTYEEQGQIVAQMGAQMKAQGQNIKSLAPAELARQTKEYATNLKVISDITGQDAKKLQEKARAESMRGALMGKLDANQQKAFKDAHATLMTLGPEAGPKMQQALMQMLAGGTVTDPVIAGNAEAMEMIKKTAGQIQSGNVDMVVETQKSTAEFADAVRANGESATSTAALMSSSFGGVGKDMATFGDSIRAYSNLETDAAEKSKENAVKQSEATDKLTKGYQDITSTMNNVQIQMEKFATDNLPAYAAILAENAKKTSEMMMTAVGLASEGIGKAMERLGQIKDKLPEDAPDKAGGALAGAAGGALAGAAIGSLVPVIGTAVGAAVGGLVGGAAGWMMAGAKKGGKAASEEQPETTLGMAAGGVLEAKRGGTLIRFAEAGMNEAGVPLPDGRRIPVDMPMGQLATSLGDVVNKFSSDQVSIQQQTSANLEQTLKQLTEKFDMLGEKLGAQTQQGGVMSEVATHLKDMKETAMKQLDLHGTMASLLGEQKDISSGILNNSY
jgi:hypothetical protein